MKFLFLFFGTYFLLVFAKDKIVPRSLNLSSRLGIKNSLFLPSLATTYLTQLVLAKVTLARDLEDDSQQNSEYLRDRIKQKQYELIDPGKKLGDIYYPSW